MNWESTSKYKTCFAESEKKETLEITDISQNVSW